LQLARHKQVHRHDRELDRQHLQALLSVRPPAGVSECAAACDPAYYTQHWRAWRRGAACAGGAVLGALARRGEAVAAAERGYSGGAPWRTAVATFGTAAAPSAAVLRGCCGSTQRCAAAWAGSARLICGRGGCFACYGAPPCGARTEGHSVVVWVLGRPRCITRRHTRSAPPIPDRTTGAEPPTHSPQPITPTTDGSGAGVAIGDRTGADIVRPAAPAPSMRSESAVAGSSLQMNWAGRCRRSSAGSPTWRICKSGSLVCGRAATALRRSALR
jgi:hypothetical protein